MTLASKTITTAAALALLTSCVNLHNDGSGRFAWDSRIVADGGRIDAVLVLNEEVLLAGSRELITGEIYRSTDIGRSWERVATIYDEDPIGNNITALVGSLDRREAWVLTGNGRLWHSPDEGVTWFEVSSPPPGKRHAPFQRTYGLACLDTGTILISDTDPDGGYIYRSEDRGEHWSAVRVANSPLYRFEQVGDGVIVNGWSGRIWKSIDDGRTWTVTEPLTSSPLYATTYLGDGIVLQASESGELFRSVDNGSTWSSQHFTSDAADDFAHVGDGVVLLTTYTGSRHVYRSDDWGRSWNDIGPVNSGAEGDWLDNVTGYSHNGQSMAVGGTGKGRIVRYSLRSSYD